MDEFFLTKKANKGAGDIMVLITEISLDFTIRTNPYIVSYLWKLAYAD